MKDPYDHGHEDTYFTYPVHRLEDRKVFYCPPLKKGLSRFRK
jgi:hypothetical protein